MRLKKEDSDGVVYLLKRTVLAVGYCAETTLAHFGLTPAQFLILFRLKEEKDISSAELARNLGVRPQTIVDLIVPLEREGLIKRRQAAEHRRILRMALTARGEELLGRALPAARQLEEELLSNLSESQVLQLRAGLTELLATAQAHDTHPLARRSAESAGKKSDEAVPTGRSAPATRSGRRSRSP